MKISLLLQRSAAIYSQSPFLALKKDDQIITYRDAHEIVLSYEKWIRNLLAQQVNDSLRRDEDINVLITFLSHNSPDSLLAIIGGMNIDRCFVDETNKTVNVNIALLNARWSPGEISKALSVKCTRKKEKHITLIFYSEEFEDLAKDACLMINVNHKQQAMNHYSISMAIPGMNNIPYDDGEYFDYGESLDTSVNIQDDAVLLFTSGTTSGPKGVRLSHISLLIQAMAKTAPPCSYNSSTRMLATTVPFFHVGGLSSALAVIMSGGVLVFPSTALVQGFNPRLALDNMSKHYERKHQIDINTLVIVPAMLHLMLAEVKEIERSSRPTVYDGVQLILIGGQSITERQLQKSKTHFPNARIVQTYACTEAASSLTFATIFDPKSSVPQSMKEEGEASLGARAGFPPHHINLKIFELDSDNIPTNQFASANTIGAIGTRGPHVMNGYWERGQKENRDGYPHKWLIMNDLGYFDEKGELFFCGRSNDVIRTGGETVFAPEVENILLGNPMIDQCAVFGIFDEKFGERVCAAIVRVQDKGIKGPGSVSITKPSHMLSEIRTFCSEQGLTRYKHPRSVFLRDELPRNSSGKVLKHILTKTHTNSQHMSKL